MNSALFRQLSAAVRRSLSSLMRNRLRTGLSLLGIVIGVFSVTVIVSLGMGVRAAVSGYLDVFGSDLIQVQSQLPGASSGTSMMALLTGANSLTFADLDALRRANLPHVTVVNGAVTAQEKVSFGGRERDAIILGVTDAYPQIDGQLKLAEGRFFSAAEDRTRALVVVLGFGTAERLFGNSPAVGERVRVGSQPATVVGVLKPIGAIMGMDQDAMVYMPLRVVQQRFTGSDSVVEFHIRVDSPENVPLAVSAVERFMRRQHRITDPAKDDFVVQTMMEIMEKVGDITKTITYLLTFLAAISLLVGGIGIMNIMLVSVTERIREVGLRKSLGARNRDILLQFLAESAILTTAGGAIGGGLGFLVTVIIIAVMNSMGFTVPYTVSFSALLAAILVAAAVGILFGLKPARRAAALDPISSLRYE